MALQSKPNQCAMPVSNQRHPACKANMRFLESLRRNGFKGASEHVGKLRGNFWMKGWAAHHVITPLAGGCGHSLLPARPPLH